MFTPIKNLISYIQKNASGGSSIFSGSNTSASEESKKMETENLKLQSNSCSEPTKAAEIEKQTSVLAGDDLSINKETVKTPTKPQTRLATTSSPLGKIASSVTAAAATVTPPPVTRSSPRKANANVPAPDSAMATTTTTTTETATTPEPSSLVIEDDDIEAQLDTSIMLKKPVKHTRTHSTEILEVKKSPQSMGRSIYISHDYNRNHAAPSPIEDELEDFRYDPTEVVASSSPVREHHEAVEDDFYLVEESNRSTSVPLSEDAHISYNSMECMNVEDDAYEDSYGGEAEDVLDAYDNDNEVMEIPDDEAGTGVIAEKIILVESEEDDDDTQDVMANVDQEYEMEEVHEDEVEETFLDLNNFPDCEVIVISETHPEHNVTPIPLDTSTTSTTSDDPLAIACEEHGSFSGDRTAALEELHLLNSSNNSQDEDTRTTTADDDLQWLRVDTSATEENGPEPPACSKSPANINLVSNDTTPEKEERNGEGSDSGLGSETSALHITNSSLGDSSPLNLTVPETQAPTSQSPQNTQINKNPEKDVVHQLNSNNNNNKSPVKLSPKPLRSNLKRRLEVDDDVVDSLNKIASTATTSSLATACSASSISGTGSVQKKPKRSINFDNVQVFYFPRQQGFGCVPSAGGCTLGMGARHVGFKTLTLAEHAAELRRAHRMQLQEINPRGSSSDDSEESEEDYLSEGSGSDLDGESNGFLQPVSPKQRRSILKAAGLRKIDTSEKAECRDIRNSREVCGCSCRDFCDPETCACSQAGIKCQVDRDMFPCGCNRDACGNTIGRVEFNPARVRTHFIHTLMRLEMENRQQQNPYSPAVVVPSVAGGAAASFYQSTHLQPASNYSSGYASPAYNSTAAAADMHPQTAANTSFYHQQQTSPIISSSIYGNGVVGSQSSLDKLLTAGSNNVSTSQSVSATTSATPQYGMDNLDSGLFCSGGAVATPSYGELMPVTAYHHNINYGNVATQQVPIYNSYNNTNASYMNAAANPNTTTTLNTPTTYSSCAVPSIPPYGTATTTEATGDYHSVNSLRTVETTTAPSCSKLANCGAVETLDAEGDASSFISLSTPLASSSRLSQINDLLQHNRNATTALVAVSQSIGAEATLAAGSPSHINGGGVNYHTTAATTSINTPPIEDAHKSCMAYVDLTAPPPLRPAPIVAVLENNGGGVGGPAEIPQPPPELQENATIDLTLSQRSTPTLLSPTRTGTTTPVLDLTSSSSPPPPSSSSTPTLNSEFLSEPTTMALCTLPIGEDNESVVATPPTPPPPPPITTVTPDIAVIQVAAGN